MPRHRQPHSVGSPEQTRTTASGVQGQEGDSLCCEETKGMASQDLLPVRSSSPINTWPVAGSQLPGPEDACVFVTGHPGEGGAGSRETVLSGREQGPSAQHWGWSWGSPCGSGSEGGPGQWLGPRRSPGLWEGLSGNAGSALGLSRVCPTLRPTGWTDDLALPSAADTGKREPGLKNKCLVRRRDLPHLPAGLYI